MGSLKKWFQQNKAVLFFLTFLVFVVYFNSLGNNFVSDDMGIVNDPNLNKISYFWKSPYFNTNLRLLIIFLTHKLFGLNPAFYRLSNLFFHLGSTWVILLLIGFFFSPPIPFIVASIFAIHPILTESVTWISGGGYSNGAFFFLLAFLIYIKARNKKKTNFYPISILLFYLSLLFSEKLIVFPLILFLHELCFGNLKSHWQKLIPFGLISGVWALQLLGLLGTRISSLETIHYQKPGLYNPFIQIPTAVSSYLELIFWPKNLTLYHSEMSFSQIEYLLRLGIFILFLFTIAYFYKKDRRIFFWLSFFLISLLPTLTPLGISWIVAERYVYLGSLGVFVIIGLGIQKIGEIISSRNLAKEKFRQGKTLRVENPKPEGLGNWRDWGNSEAKEMANQISFIILTTILIFLSFRTILRNNDWKNQDTLWLAAAKTSPSSPQNHNNLGDYYGRQGNFQRSIEEFQKAIELSPGYADAYHNLGNTYVQIGEIDKAIENYQKALEFGPHLWQSHQALAAVYFDQEKFDLVKQEIEEAIRISPQNSNLYTNLAIVYLKLNDPQNAQQALNQALLLNPENRQAKEILYGIRE